LLLGPGRLARYDVTKKAGGKTVKSFSGAAAPASAGKLRDALEKNWVDWCR
jgi:hypothetical protein